MINVDIFYIKQMPDICSSLWIILVCLQDNNLQPTYRDNMFEYKN